MNREGFKRSIGARLVAVLFAVGMLISSAGPGTATEPVVQQGLVDKARITFQRFMVDKQMTWFHEHLKEAEGLLIIPELLKAGFIFGGSGGTGVPVVRDRKTGDWSEPAFYTIGSVSFGAQIGGESAEVIMMAMTRKAIDSLFASSFKLGGDTSITRQYLPSAPFFSITLLSFSSRGLSISFFLALSLSLRPTLPLFRPIRPLASPPLHLRETGFLRTRPRRALHPTPGGLRVP